MVVDWRRKAAIMETKELIEQLKSCGEKLCPSCPDIECCIGPNWLLRKAAEKLEELYAEKKA